MNYTPMSWFNDLDEDAIANQRFNSMANFGFAPRDNGVMLNPTVNPGLDTSSAFQPSFWQKRLGYADPKTNQQFQGDVMAPLSAMNNLGNMWLGMKTYGLAEDQLKFDKQAFNKNFAAQRNVLNSQLADRQRRRVMENPAAMPVDEYMAQYGIV